MKKNSYGWKMCLAYWDFRCAYCLRRVANLTMDHYIPRHAGGTEAIHNIVPACESCNISKAGNLPTEWCYKSQINHIERYFKALRLSKDDGYFHESNFKVRRSGKIWGLLKTNDIQGFFHKLRKNETHVPLVRGHVRTKSNSL